MKFLSGNPVTLNPLKFFKIAGGLIKFDIHQTGGRFTAKLPWILGMAFLWLFVLPAKGQTKLFKSTVYDYDTAYINRAPSLWSIRLYSVNKYQLFRVNSRSTDASLHYAPNRFYALGIGGSYQRINLDLGVSAFVSKPQNDPVNKSRVFDFIGSLYAAQHLLEFYLQNGNGMFGWLRNNGNPAFPADTIIPYRHDINAFNFGLDYNYLFNSRKITMGTMIGTEIQKRSAGGALAGIFFSAYHLHADSSIVPVAYDPVFEDHAQFTDLGFFNLGLTGGYAYNVVLPRHLFLTLSATPGFSLSRSEIKAFNVWYVGGEPVNVAFKLIVRAAFGYGGKKMYGVVTVVNDRTFINFSNKNYFNQDIGKLKLVLGYRLD